MTTIRAIIRWKDSNTGKKHQKTFDVIKNEPNHIVNLARDNGWVGKHDYITTIKCGRYIYEWNGEPNY